MGLQTQVPAGREEQRSGVAGVAVSGPVVLEKQQRPGQQGHPAMGERRLLWMQGCGTLTPNDVPEGSGQGHRGGWARGTRVFLPAFSYTSSYCTSICSMHQESGKDFEDFLFLWLPFKKEKRIGHGLFSSQPHWSIIAKDIDFCEDVNSIRKVGSL